MAEDGLCAYFAYSCWVSFLCPSKTTTTTTKTEEWDKCR
jgi:hypothetical protein